MSRKSSGVLSPTGTKFVYKKRKRNEYSSWNLILIEGFFIVNTTCGGTMIRSMQFKTFSALLHCPFP